VEIKNEMPKKAFTFFIKKGLNEDQGVVLRRHEKHVRDRGINQNNESHYQRG